MIIVTGGAGFLGSAMVWKLNQEGLTDIVIVDDLGSGEKWKNLVNLRYNEYFHKEVFLELVARDEIPWRVEAVVHMGACSSTTQTDAEYLMDNNYRYSRILCEWCLDSGTRLINASSAATYGDGSLGFEDSVETMELLKPLNMYGYSKQLFDLWAHRAGALGQIASLKFFNVFGPNEYHKGDMKSVICKAAAQIQETGKLELFKSYKKEYPHGGQQRDFVYVKDCVDVMWWLINTPGANGLFNVGTGQARTWNDLAEAVFAAMGLAPDIDYIDMPEAIRGKYQYFTQADTARLKKAGCPVQFMPLEQAVQDYVAKYLMAEDPHLEMVEEIELS
ncbi:MAG: ADP-glyceromanno-heptose 6-epimerase [Desulfovibrio sp.]|nr:MAG: ADP-glyceromanno-heptose 6-epimerase [Desulfovibrio sp.]